MDFIICPTCQGEGLVDNKKCRECHGLGFYAWYGGYLLCLKRMFDRRDVIQAKLGKFIKRLITVLLIIFGFLGAFCLIKVILTVSRLIQIPFMQLPVIQVPAFDIPYLNWPKNTLLLCFWASILTNCFLYYFFECAFEERRKIWPKTSREASWLPSSWPEVRRLPSKVRIDAAEALSESAIQLIQQSQSLAQKLKHKKIEPIHLLASSLPIQDIILVINRLGLNWDILKQNIANSLAKIPADNKFNEVIYSPATKKVFLSAYALAGDKKRLNIGPLELLESLVSFEGPVKEIFYNQEVGLAEIKNVCLWIDVYEALRQEYLRFTGRARFKPKGPINRAFTAIATPYLDTYSEDLTQAAANGYLSFCIDREQEFKEIFRIFEGTRQSLILVGPPGVGKTTIINGLARQMATEDVPKLLQDKRLVGLSISQIVAGASKPGEVEGRLQVIMNEVIRSGNIILFIKDIHNMVGVRTTEGELDISEILASALKNRFFLLLATTTPQEYRRLIETKSLGEVLQKVEVGEPDKNITIQILEAKAANVEGREQVYFSYGALSKIVDLSTRYFPERYLPAKAISLLEEVAIMVKNKRGQKTVIRAEDVAELVAEKTKIPVTKVTEKESVKLMNLEEEIHKRLIDQNEAVSMVATAIRRARAGLRNLKRPIANLLFLGPTGVGKTELAKTVAEVFFGNENMIIRLDMSEYQEKNSISRLIGTPDGEKTGQLTDAVRENPHSLMLLDEIEKAHPDILNVFLQVMDDGRLTDSLGRTIDFTNTIIIGTSNAGSQFIQDEIRKGTAVAAIQEVLVQEKLAPYFRPEFLNRFDGVIVFKPLGVAEIEQITKLLLDKLAKQLAEKGITLQMTDKATKELAVAGFDPLFGARPLQRVIQKQVSDVLTEYLLTGKLNRRDTIIFEGQGSVKINKAESI